jgi:hypothetical protein
MSTGDRVCANTGDPAASVLRVGIVILLGGASSSFGAPLARARD